MKGKPLAGLLTLCFLLGMAGRAGAVSSYLTTFNSTYPGVTTINSCTLCHTGSPSKNNLNPYASDFAAAGHNFKTIESKDSDGDGFTNLQEITARTYPGNAASKPSSDTTAPTVTGFTLPAFSNSLTVAISTLTATDNTAVTGFLITETATAPAATATGWTATLPAAYTFTTTGAKTLYAWAKDAAGNVSTSRSAGVTVDTIAPSVTAFVIPATSSAFAISITTLTATDGVGVTGYFVSESSTTPAASAVGWAATAPGSYTFSTDGAKTLYAWARDAAGNVSTSRSASVTITLPDTTAPAVTAFVIPTTSTSLTVPITTLTATDTVGVTAYFVSESSTAPAASAVGWAATAPGSYTFSTDGAKTLYAWARDTAGNVSTSLSASVTIALPDTTAPTVTVFVIPATSVSLTVPITTFMATDNVAVTGYLITETASSPSVSATSWTASTPASYSFVIEGAKTLYAWAKDAVGNVSASKSASVTITLADTTAPSVTAFAIPATSTSLIVPVSTFTASDNIGVTGYLLTETTATPSASATGWTATASASYSFTTEGAKTLYAWARDAAGNVSASRSASVTITLADTTVPTVTAFAIPAISSSLTVHITSFTASDNVGVTGYLLTEAAGTPSASATGWTATAPGNYTFTTEGAKTLYAWARDAAGNVSASRSASVTITLADTTAPTVTAFAIPATSTSLIVPVSTFTASDNIGVTGYLLTETTATPSASATGWTATAPGNYTFTTEGAKTLYAWAKDAAGNVSASKSASVTITLADTTAPTVTAFAVPATSTSLIVPVSTFTASDNIGVTGYLLTETTATPSASATGWTAAAPGNYTFTTEGAKTLYAWAKDAAGNVSASKSAGVIITLPDTTSPAVTAFAIPATSTSLIVSVSTFTASDNISVTGYLLTETTAMPSASATGWTATAPGNYTFTTEGAKTLYAWAKDAAGNVSASKSASVTITPPSTADTTPPTVTAFALPAAASLLTVPVTTFTASDLVGVTGYLLTESAAAPTASLPGWSASIPASYTFASAGAKVLYAWAKDAASNVSVGLSASVTITLPDPNLPDLSAWNGKWFKVTIHNGGFYSGSQGLTEDRQIIAGYLKMGAWDPSTGILGANLYGKGASGAMEQDGWWAVGLPLHYLAGGPLSFICWSQTEGDPLYAFTVRIKGQVKKGKLNSAAFKTIGGYFVQTGDDSTGTDDLAGWLKIRGRLTPGSKVSLPPALMAE